MKVFHSICQQIRKTQQWPEDWDGSNKECSNHWTITLISHASKVMFKILQARLQYYVNQELPDNQTGLRKGRGTRDLNCQHSLVHRERKKGKEKCFPGKHLSLFYQLY